MSKKHELEPSTPARAFKVERLSRTNERARRLEQRLKVLTKLILVNAESFRRLRFHERTGREGDEAEERREAGERAATAGARIAVFQ